MRVRDTQLQNWLQAEPERREEALDIWRMQGSLMTMQRMRLEAPYMTRAMQRSIGWRPTPRGFTVYVSAPYAIFVEKGTRPHIIEPKTKKALRFFPSALGVLSGAPQSLLGLQASMLQPIFARRVHHPGTKPNPFVQRTRDAMRSRLRDLAETIWRNVWT